MGCMQEKKGPGPCPHCGFDESTYEVLPHHLPPGTILNGKYLVGKVLGQGGFGITYLGWDLNLDVKLAIKEYYPNGYVIREATCGPTVSVMTGSRAEFFQKGLAKFVDEAKRLGKFWGLPGIVAVKDYFQANHTAYIVMEYAEGETLKEVLAKNNGRLQPEVIFGMLQPLFESLDTVHKAGIIHRDISPDNIMVDERGHVKLLDFGAAREFLAQDEKSLSIMLKPGYAPEEQYRSRGHQGPWTDVYSLCATIYRALTGTTPLESLDRMETDSLQPPSAFGVIMPTWQEAALMKGLSIYGNDRYPTMKELETALYTPPQGYGASGFYGTSGNSSGGGTTGTGGTGGTTGNGNSGGTGGSGGNAGNSGTGGTGGNTGGFNGTRGFDGTNSSYGNGINSGTSGNYPQPKKKKQLIIFAAAAVIICLLAFGIFKGMGSDTGTRSARETDTESHGNEFKLAAGNDGGGMRTTLAAGKDSETEKVTESAKETQKETQTEKPTEKQTETETEPVTETEPPQEDKVDMDEVDAILRDYGGGATFGSFVVDIKREQVYYGKNSDKSMISSALNNICTLFTVAMLCDNDIITMDDEIPFSYTFSGRGIKSKADDGKYFTVKNLLTDMLEYSDNNAANSIMNYISIDNINTVCTEICDFPSVDVQRNYESNSSLDNYASPEDIGAMLYLLYIDKLDSVDRGFMRSYFSIADKTANKGVAKYIPSGYTVLNHNGVRTDVYNEAAIIYGNDAEYIVVFFSNSGVQDTEAEAIAKATEYIHEALTK